jgi:hypothetical protein
MALAIICGILQQSESKSDWGVAFGEPFKGTSKACSNPSGTLFIFPKLLLKASGQRPPKLAKTN